MLILPHCTLHCSEFAPLGSENNKTISKHTDVIHDSYYVVVGTGTLLEKKKKMF